MGRLIDQEMTDTRGEVFSHSSLETRDTTYHAEPHREAPGSGKRQKE